MATAAQLKKQAEALLQKASLIEAKEKKSAVDKILSQANAAGITIGDLIEISGWKPAKATGSSASLKPKYRGPNGELWAGRGHQPLWLKEALKKGKKKESFLIKG